MDKPQTCSYLTNTQTLSIQHHENSPNNWLSNVLHFLASMKGIATQPPTQVSRSVNRCHSILPSCGMLGRSPDTTSGLLYQVYPRLTRLHNGNISENRPVREFPKNKHTRLQYPTALWQHSRLFSDKRCSTPTPPP